MRDDPMSADGQKDRGVPRPNHPGRARPLTRAWLVTLSVLLGAVSAGAQDPQPAAPAAKKPAAKPAKASRKEAPPAPQLVLEPKALDVLKAASGRLAAARTMRFRAVASYESPSRLGPALVYTTKAEV